MNLPNKLTILRMIMVPVFFVFMVNVPGSWAAITALVLFCVASLTDALDGHIARSRNLITNFGKFMDPIADKLLVTSALIGFTATGILNPWATLIILSREFIVTAFRIVAMGEGVVIAASNWGKLKTITQMVAIIMLLISNILKTFEISFALYDIISLVVVWISVVITIISGWDYIYKNKKLISLK
ncbi:MAG: CDP-diacylglycerol--glycerol-3-phosphate 3-phosphatidyltransferase [Eubacteriales bacterium]|nr:CDP-diacylglycerol--glycerol-3-phosphate 3-phosphatidyltransferase [Eubacteriales bacterium]